MKRRIFWMIAGLTLLGAATAATAYWSTHGSRGDQVIRQLVWTVFGTPAATFVGYLLADRKRGWQAAFWCFMIYFFSIFVAARLERLILGAAVADASGHDLYFKLTLVLNVVSGLALAVQAARSRSKMQAQELIGDG